MSAIATITIDLAALLADGKVTLHFPAPRVITDDTAEHVGLTRRQFADLRRDMAKDPVWSSKVISFGKVRSVETDDVIAYLRHRTAEERGVPLLAAAPPQPTPPANADEEILDRWRNVKPKTRRGPRKPKAPPA